MRPLNFPDLTGRIILVVEDNDDALDMVGTFLRVCGAHILPASTGFAALAYLDTEPRIDAVVTDLSMPGMDGIELLRRLRAHPSRPDIPAIALTGFHEHYLDTSGFSAFLRKPADLDRLCKAIIEGIDQKHPHTRAG